MIISVQIRTSGTMWYEQTSQRQSCPATVLEDGFGKTKNSSYQKNLIQTAKHGGGSVMAWGCFRA